jgi:hypothetical protein
MADVGAAFFFEARDAPLLFSFVLVSVTIVPFVESSHPF